MCGEIASLLYTCTWDWHCKFTVYMLIFLLSGSGKTETSWGGLQTYECRKVETSASYGRTWLWGKTSNNQQQKIASISCMIWNVIYHLFITVMIMIIGLLSRDEFAGFTKLPDMLNMSCKFVKCLAKLSLTLTDKMSGKVINVYSKQLSVIQTFRCENV